MSPFAFVCSVVLLLAVDKLLLHEILKDLTECEQAKTDEK
jgi:hypothetical protein